VHIHETSDRLTRVRGHGIVHTEVNMKTEKAQGGGMIGGLAALIGNTEIGGITPLLLAAQGPKALAAMLVKSGAISPAQAKEFSSSSVSSIDVDNAKKLAKSSKGGKNAAVANALAMALKQKYDGSSQMQQAAAYALDLPKAMFGK
jgi:predicted acyl esterase